MLSKLAQAIGITGEIPQPMYEIYNTLEIKDNIYEEEYIERLQSEFSLFDESNYEAVKAAHKALKDNKNLLKWALLSVEYIKKCKTYDEMEKVPMPYFDGRLNTGSKTPAFLFSKTIVFLLWGYFTDKSVRYPEEFLC